MQIQNSLYHQLQKLIWAAFVGVISFQLIVPQIWGYMNKLAGISYSTGYFLFITGYAALVPCLAIVWLLKNYGDIKKLLFPVGEPETDLWCTRYLYGVIANCALQFLIFLVTLSVSYWTTIDYHIFVAIQLLSLLSSGVLITLGGIIAKKRIDIEVNSPKGKKNAPQLKYSLKLTAIACVAFFSVFAVWDGLYLFGKCKENYIPFNYQGNNGFKLLEAKSAIGNAKNAIDTTSFLYTLSPLKSTSADSLKRIRLRQRATAVWRQINTVEVLKISENITSTDRIKIQNATENATEITKRATYLNDLNFGICRNQTDSLKYLKAVKYYLQILEDKSKNSAQKVLGATMRDHQAKILFSLLNIFFALLALYVFLQMNAQIDGLEYKDLLKKKRTDTIRSDNGEILVKGTLANLERDLIAAEKKQAGSNSLTEGSWFIIVVSIWMLLPLFKPMQDKDIDTESPYKLYTLSPIIEKAAGIDNRITNNYNNCYNQTNGGKQLPGGDEFGPAETVDLQALTDTLNKVNKATIETRSMVEQIQKETNGTGRKISEIQAKTKHIEP